MPTILTDVEVRVLGSLVEKQLATPEYYPLTLNALTLACNQKNNRNPVTVFDEETVEQAVESLREKNLVYIFYGSTSRVPKYKHVMPEVLHLGAAELAALCVLMLRGAQTIGEIKDRSARLYEFSGLQEAQDAIESLSSKDDPLVARLPRQAGQKEARYAHLLSGEMEAPTAEEKSAPPKPVAKPNDNQRLAQLEADVQSLKAEVQTLHTKFEEFRKQFE